MVPVCSCHAVAHEETGMIDDEGSRGEFLKILAEMGEEPAFIERARVAEDALTSLLERCAAGRAELLEWPRRHFTRLRRRIDDDWDRITPLVTDDDAGSMFVGLAAELPAIDQSRPSMFATDHSLLRNFLESAKRFNRAWGQFLDNAGLGDVNRVRDEYNRFYPVEKSCAFGLDSVNDGFTALPVLTRTFLETRFPFLKVPTMV